MQENQIAAGPFLVKK